MIRIPTEINIGESSNENRFEKNKSYVESSRSISFGAHAGFPCQCLAVTSAKNELLMSPGHKGVSDAVFLCQCLTVTSAKNELLMPPGRKGV